MILFLIVFIRLSCLDRVSGEAHKTTMSIYMAAVVQKDNDSIGLNHCVMGSTSRLFDLPSNYNHVKYYGNLINYLNQNLCSTVPTEVGPEGVLFTHIPDQCNLSRIIRHVRLAKNVKILVMLTDSFDRVPESFGVSNTDPIFVILDKHVFSNDVQPEQLSKYKFGMYLEKSLQNSNAHFLACLCMGLVLLLTMLLLISLTVYSAENLVKISSEISKTKKSIAYVFAGLLVLGAILLFVLDNHTYVWINVILFFVFGTHSCAFLLTLVLQHRTWFQRITFSWDKIGLTNEDFKFYITFILCSTIPIIWIIHRNNQFGNFLNILIGIFICNEISLVLGMMLTFQKGNKMLGLYIFVLFVYTISPLLIIVIAKVVDIVLEKFLNQAKSKMVYCNEDLPFKFKIPLSMFKGILVNCDILYKNQNLIHHYVDVIISGSINVYLILFLTSKKLLKTIHLFSLIGGFSIGVLIYFMVCVFVGNFLPATLLIVICALMPVSVILWQNHQFKTLMRNEWIKPDPNQDTILKDRIPPSGDEVEDV